MEALMKRNRWFLPLVLATVLIGFTGWVGAQGGPGQHHGQGHGWDMGSGPGDHGRHGDPHRLLHILQNVSDLGVTEEQLEQIETVFETAQPQIEALTEQMRTEREAWHEACDPAVFDEGAARQFANAQAAVHADLMILRMQTRAEALSYLTPEQLDSLKELKGNGRGRSCGKGRSGR